MGLEPTTFSLGSWHGFGDARASGAVRVRPRATCEVKHGQGMTGCADQNARTSADGSDRGSGDGASGRRSTHPQAFGRVMGQYARTFARPMGQLASSTEVGNNATGEVPPIMVDTSSLPT
jgi:hypothetical protein